VRLLPAVLLATAIVLAGCGDDDDDGPRAQAVTTTTPAEDECAGADPEPPAGDVIATSGDLLFTSAASGASADVVSVHGLVDCAYVQLELDGRPADLAYGGTVTHGDGVRCDGQQVTVLTATSDDGVSSEASAVTYEADGATLVEVDRESATIDATTEAEALDPYYRFDC
jgi:hypothetical protein